MKKMLFIISLTLVCGLVSCSSKSLTLCSKNLSTINADPDFFPIDFMVKKKAKSIMFLQYQCVLIDPLPDSLSEKAKK